MLLQCTENLTKRCRHFKAFRRKDMGAEIDSSLNRALEI
jgi:hypothetical protein